MVIFILIPFATAVLGGIVGWFSRGRIITTLIICFLLSLLILATMMIANAASEGLTWQNWPTDLINLLAYDAKPLSQRGESFTRVNLIHSSCKSFIVFYVNMGTLFSICLNLYFYSFHLTVADQYTHTISRRFIGWHMRDFRAVRLASLGFQIEDRS